VPGNLNTPVGDVGTTAGRGVLSLIRLPARDSLGERGMVAAQAGEGVLEPVSPLETGYIVTWFVSSPRPRLSARYTDLSLGQNFDRVERDRFGWSEFPCPATSHG
jgi:hypothetical protein